jgi:hypothetical protein
MSNYTQNTNTPIQIANPAPLWFELSKKSQLSFKENWLVAMTM